MGELTKKLKSHARRMYIPMIIAAALCSLLGLSILGGALITRMNEFKELNDYTEYQLQTGDYYKLSDFNIILDWFAEDDDGKYYLILRESDSKWMGLYLKSSADKKTAEKIIEDNDRYLNDETDSLSDSSISVKGRLRNMDSDEKQYFQEYLEASGYSSTELYEVADFRTLDTSDTNSGMLIAGILISAVSVFFIALLFIIPAVSEKFKKKNKPVLEAAVTAEDSVTPGSAIEEVPVSEVMGQDAPAEESSEDIEQADVSEAPSEVVEQNDDAEKPEADND